MNQEIKNADDAMNFVIKFLINKSGNKGYRISNFMSSIGNFDFIASDVIPDKYQKDCLENTMILDALADLTRRGVLRQSFRYDCPNEKHHLPHTYYNGGYSFTQEGKKWLLENLENSDERFVFGSSSCYRNILEPFKEKLGEVFFSRASEASSCYQFNLYIATCAMAGSAAESILYQLLSVKLGDTEAVNILKRHNGRNQGINELVGSEDRIKSRIKSFMDKLSSWRNDSVHSKESYFEDFHAYESLASLLGLAKYSFENFETITRKDNTL